MGETKVGGSCSDQKCSDKSLEEEDGLAGQQCGEPEPPTAALGCAP